MCIILPKYNVDDIRYSVYCGYIQRQRASSTRPIRSLGTRFVVYYISRTILAYIWLIASLLHDEDL